MALEINRKLEVIVRSPYWVSSDMISSFISAKEAWLIRHMRTMQERARSHPELTPEQRNLQKEQAKKIIPPRVAYFGERMDLHPAGVTITKAQTRFGSCNAKNHLAFSCQLVEYPLEAIDYVVVHELAHIVHKHHGLEFYDLIARYLPDWRERKRLLSM